MLAKGISAEVQITLRSTTLSGPSIVRPIPLEIFAANKDMGRILIRRGGETIGAGKESRSNLIHVHLTNVTLQVLSSRLVTEMFSKKEATAPHYPTYVHAWF